MDDLLTGAADVTQAVKIHDEVSNLLKMAGFELQKWSSNSEEFLETIKENTDNKNQFEIKFDKVIKTLGLFWDRVDDKFKFSITLPDDKKFTKRSVLAEVARLFDPFGWLAPTIVKAKIFIQKLWLCTSGWDEPLPTHLKEEWLHFRGQLPQLQKVELNRWIFIDSKVDRVELHGFADASTAAYAAVIYIKVVRKDEVKVSILESKTKVAPLKQISVPRLELCAAVLVAKLLSEAANILKIPKQNIFAYTDSMVVLAWIEGQPLKWQTFVANRVTEIQNRLDNDRWNHVISDDNPADLASRGIEPKELKNKNIWWNGPKWLIENNALPKEKKRISETNLEKRIQHTKTFHVEKEKSVWEGYSTLIKTVRVLTYCRRFLKLKEKKTVRKELPNYLTSEEMKETLNKYIKTEQEEHFEEEIKDIKEKGKIKKRSKLLALYPYLDTEGLLRVGGRIQAADVPVDYKHPIIIPKDTHLAMLLIKDAHSKLLHGGMALTMNYLKSRYWIIGLKPLIKKHYRECVICVRHRGATVQPQMGDLPRVRISPGRPFHASGVDFAGPIQMRVSKGRGHKAFKGYICLFVCMKTRAIHLEAVSDLTSQGFIAAFRRFVSRRGHCADLYSDNGLNFVGAAKELTLMLNHSMTGVLKEIAEMISNDGTTWHFIPPKAPNFGGLWEAGIKAVKTHLIKTIGNSTLTFEEMSTLLCQIEACLNSRPIGNLTDHPNDMVSLTPAHFLVGEPLITIPEKHNTDEFISPLNRWRMLQKMLKHFWNRWSKEFLHTLQQRHKWQSKSIPPQVGDIVIIKDEDLPPTKWLLARIKELHTGPDGEIRVATLKCKNSTLKRPLSKLICLPREQ
ncbi:uncharacterized protein LOC113232331 [Hyposmocoma kahamanoa]|uniref:uncharacterized protein LOC113232331 n=1 Tax=Hyposmocoma kahamanoa TaxID=1477025 RepID=UPI000E6D9659|nr:uncharacterized protein LOC113232331 [Hyposmocoma kahamanoa]